MHGLNVFVIANVLLLLSFVSCKKNANSTTDLKSEGAKTDSGGEYKGRYCVMNQDGNLNNYEWLSDTSVVEISKNQELLKVSYLGKKNNSFEFNMQSKKESCGGGCEEFKNEMTSFLFKKSALDTNRYSMTIKSDDKHSSIDSLTKMEDKAISIFPLTDFTSKEITNVKILNPDSCDTKIMNGIYNKLKIAIWKLKSGEGKGFLLADYTKDPVEKLLDLDIKGENVDDNSILYTFEGYGVDNLKDKVAKITFVGSPCKKQMLVEIDAIQFFGCHFEFITEQKDE